MPAPGARAKNGSCTWGKIGDLMEMGSFSTYGGVPYTGPRFDCGQASTPDEIAICKYPRVAIMDKQLAQQYAEIKDRLQSDALRDFTASQQQWLDTRRSCGSDRGCLLDAYARRSVALDVMTCNLNHCNGR